MTSPRTVCFVYLALLFGTAHANTTNTVNVTVSVTKEANETGTQNDILQTTEDNFTATSIIASGNIKTTSVKTTSVQTTSQQSVCTPATTEASKGQCIFFLPTGNILHLIVVALTVGCLALLLTTLICTCQVCHLRQIISSLQPRHNNIDLRAIREKSESPYRDEGRVDGQPTETCILLSEVTTPQEEVTAAQEESREDEDRVLEIKSEENKDTEQPSTAKDPNGDVTQENSHVPDAKAPESSDTGV